MGDEFSPTSTQLKFIKNWQLDSEHTNNNLYRYSKIYVNIKYSTIKYSRITNTKKIKSMNILVIIQRVDNKLLLNRAVLVFGGWNLV